MAEPTLEEVVDAKDAWLDSVEAIDPEIAKPELWTVENFNAVFTENKPVMDHLDKVVKSLVPMATVDGLIGAMTSLLMLGYLMGQQSIKKLN